MKTLKAASAAIALVLSTGVNAATITIGGAITQPQYVGGSSSYTGTFDLSASLDNLLFTSPYDISSARLNISYADDASDNGYVQLFNNIYNTGWTEWYRGGYINPSWNRTYDNYSESRYNNERETAQIDTGSGAFSQSTSRYATTYQTIEEYSRGAATYTRSLGVQTISGTCSGGLFSAPYSCTVTDDAYETIKDYDRHEYLDYSVGNVAYENIYGDVLASFAETGLLTFDISSSAGDFMVTDVSLVIDVLETPAPVPAPAAVWLFGSGLLGLIGIARRKSA